MFQPTRNIGTSIDNLVNDFFNFDNRYPRSLLTMEEQEFYPQLDVSETDSHYCLEMDLPGVTKENIDIKVDNNVITIKGKKELNKEQKDGNFYTRERFSGNFQRSFFLPHGVDADKIDASFKDGVLTIKAPKTDSSTAKAIEIKD
jgi:HSP20 family protein